MKTDLHPFLLIAGPILLTVFIIYVLAVSIKYTGLKKRFKLHRSVLSSRPYPIQGIHFFEATPHPFASKYSVFNETGYVGAIRMKFPQTYVEFDVGDKTYELVPTERKSGMTWNKSVISLRCESREIGKVNFSGKPLHTQMIFESNEQKLILTDYAEIGPRKIRSGYKIEIDDAQVGEVFSANAMGGKKILLVPPAIGTIMSMFLLTMVINSRTKD
jgi:hypothetical protein